jgi:hypothetical protein
MSSIEDRLNQIIRELIDSGITLEQAVEAFESKYIAAAMDANRGNVTKASRALGVHRNTLHNKLRTQNGVSAYVAAVKPRRKASRAVAPASSRKRSLSAGNSDQ